MDLLQIHRKILYLTKELPQHKHHRQAHKDRKEKPHKVLKKHLLTRKPDLKNLHYLNQFFQRSSPSTPMRR